MTDDFGSKLDHLTHQLEDVHEEVQAVRTEASAAAVEARGAHAQARKTNGRVTSLEHLVRGNPDVPLPSGHRDRGLVGQVHDQSQIVAQFATVVKGLKVVGGLLFAVAVALVGNLAAGLFG